jgi:hypothetical protein
MDQKITQIINELIALDPSFANHKDDLARLLINILSAKPDPKIDQQFVINLRQKLMETK